MAKISAITSFVASATALGDISDRILADGQIAGDPAIASAFRNERRYVRCELVRLWPLTGLPSELSPARLDSGKAEDVIPPA
jgi:hypothetical protein